MFFSALAVVACSAQSPEDALNEAAKQLQNNLENKQAGAAVKQLRADFLALSMRIRNVNIAVINRQCQLDAGFNYRGQFSAQVAVTGAQGLIPELDY